MFSGGNDPAKAAQDSPYRRASLHTFRLPFLVCDFAGDCLGTPLVLSTPGIFSPSAFEVDAARFRHNTLHALSHSTHTLTNLESHV